MKYLLDTNVISEIISKKPNTSVLEWLDSLDQTMVYLSIITIGEIQKGIEKLPPSKRKEDLQTWLDNDLLLRFDGKITQINVAVIRTWGVLTGQLEKTGRPLAAIDSLVAAIALEGSYALVTRNEDDFTGTGVTIVNPWK
ncbi:MAG TPA: type II toxin-antitoxin system VapC family toxin [Roseiflexaceae bacterium]|nr:type II toxin-antitoxin system VapC family toxin [Roseiflexaceae bacterium]